MPNEPNLAQTMKSIGCHPSGQILGKTQHRTVYLYVLVAHPQREHHSGLISGGGSDHHRTLAYRKNLLDRWNLFISTSGRPPRFITVIGQISRPALLCSHQQLRVNYNFYNQSNCWVREYRKSNNGYIWIGRYNAFFSSQMLYMCILTNWHIYRNKHYYFMRIWIQVYRHVFVLTRPSSRLYSRWHQ